MSELTSCNRCTLESIRRRAKREGERVYLRPGWRGGVQVYVAPKGEKLVTGDDSPHAVAWFMELSAGCCC